MKNAILLSASVLVLVGMAVWYFSRPEPPCSPSEPNCPQPTSTPAATPTPPPPGPITISIANASTKEEWMEQAVSTFNARSSSERSLQVDGKPVLVEVLCEEVKAGKCVHYRSGPMVEHTLQEKIKPTIVSPGEESWVLKLNKEWRSLYGKEITTGKAPALVQTPLVIAMWRSRAQALGCWPVATPDCTWARVRALATSPDGWGMFGHSDWGRFKFGYGYVGESNSGTWTAVMLCMVGVAKTSNLILDDVSTENGCGQMIAEVEKAKVHSGVRSAWLLGWMRTGGPEYLDAMTTNEKEVIEFNQANEQKLREPLVSVYPQDLIVVVGQPFAILNGAPWVTAEQVKAAEIFREFLLSRQQQELALSSGLRPVHPDVKLGSPIESRYGANPQAKLAAVELPETIVIDRIIEVWHRVKKHTNIVLVFDKSGSMQGEKIAEAVKGATGFVQAMDGEDWLAWMPFDDRVYSGVQGLKRDVGEQLENEISASAANGGTSLYDAIAQAYRMLEDRRKVQGDTARYGLVVLSDGKDTNSKEYTMTLLEALLQPSEKDPHGIQIHTIGIGADADDAVLTKIARSAHGTYSKVQKSADVTVIYRSIATYY